MVFRYNTEQQAIEARNRIAAVEGLPKFKGSETIYFINYTDVNNSYYINLIAYTDKQWYASEASQADELLTELPIAMATINVIEIPSDKVSLLSNYHLYNVDGKYYIDANTAMSIGIVGTVVEIIVEL